MDLGLGRLGQALVAAVERDFEEPDRQFGVRYIPQQPVLARHAGSPLLAPPLFSRPSRLPHLNLAPADALSRRVCVRRACAQTLTCLTAGQLIHVGRVHLNGLSLYQIELANALADANREGEEARREERLRIWGYA